jgi:hypothetical protein
MFNDEKLKLEADYQVAKQQIQAATPDDFDPKNMGVVTEEFANELGKRAQIAQEFNDALSFFSQARLNKDLRLAGENEQAQEDARERDFKRQQNFAAVSALISGAQAVVQALAVQPPGVGIALAAVTGLKAAAQIAAIKSARYQRSGTGSTSLPSSSTSTPSGSSAQPSFSFFGQPNSGNNLGTGERPLNPQSPNQNITVDVKISESEITNAQRRVANVTNAAEL